MPHEGDVGLAEGRRQPRGPKAQPSLSEAPARGWSGGRRSPQPPALVACTLAGLRLSLSGERSPHGTHAEPGVTQPQRGPGRRGHLCVSHCGTVGLRRRGRGWEGVAGPPSSGRTWLQAHGHRRPRPQGQHGLGRWTKLWGARHRLPCWGGAQALAVSTYGDVRVTRGRHPARGSCQSMPASGRRRGAEGPDAPRRACQRRRLQSQHSRSHAGRVGGPPSQGARASTSGDREAPLSSAGSPQLRAPLAA